MIEPVVSKSEIWFATTSNEIKKIAELWKNIVKPNVTPQDAAMTQHSASMNLIDNNSEEKYYGLAIRKTKIPPKTMQRIQISQMIEPVDSKSEIWLAIPSNEIPENLLCEEQIISYDKGEGFILFKWNS